MADEDCTGRPPRTLFGPLVRAALLGNQDPPPPGLGRRPPDRRLERAASSMYRKMQAIVPEQDRVVWHALPEDQREAVREMWAAGLQGWRDAGGEV